MTRKERREAGKEIKLERWFRNPQTKALYRKWLTLCKCRDGGKQESTGYCSRCQKAIPIHLEKIELKIKDK